MALVPAAAAGAGALWLAPPVVDRAVLAVLLAVAAGLAAAGWAAAGGAWSALRRHDRERRRAQARAAWREEASRDDLLDDEDPEDGFAPSAGTGPAAATPPGDPAGDLGVVLDVMEDAVVLVDAEGWVTAANAAATAALGAAAAPESRWDAGTAWPAPLVVVRRPLPGGGAVILGRDPVRDRLRAAQTGTMDAMAEFAGAIVHDVNNALGAVAGYADFLVADLPGGSPQADYAARILTAVDRKKTMLRQLLAVCRNSVPELRPVDADRVLADTAALLRAALPPGVGLSVREDAELPPFPGNAALLARALAAVGADLRGSADVQLGLRATLWSGAVDASTAPPGWRVFAPLSPHRRPHLVFELRGSGVAPSVTALRAIVDPLLAARERLRRADATPPSAPSSTLPPAALAVARWHDGGLVVWTHPAEGTVVRLFLPLALVPDGPAPPRETAAAPPCPPPCHVLVVDDEPAMGDWLSVSLERLGCEVAVCESAGEALEIVMDEPACFDVVVAGPSAGGMTGAALIVRLKALRPDLSCVLCGEVEGRPDGEAVPADLFLPRPVDSVGLARAVATFVPVSGRRP